MATVRVAPGRLTLYVTRASVAAGDDLDAPHAARLTLPRHLSAEAFVTDLVGHYSLPHVAGGRATWVLASGVPLAVVAEEWRQPRVFWRPSDWSDGLDWAGDTLRLHFSYLAQQPPELVHQILSQLQLRAVET